jgi:hypothetical protein
MIFEKKKILDKFFKLSFDSEKLNFSALIEKREKLVVILSDNCAENFRILSYLISWFGIFNKIVIILPEFQITFFEKTIDEENVVFRIISTRVSRYTDSIILNFSRNVLSKKIIVSAVNSITGDIDNFSNLRFFPLPRNAISLLREFADFFNLKFCALVVVL